MHVPDHYLDPATTATTALVATAALTMAVARTRRELATPGGPSLGARAAMAGAVTGVIFAGQMVNFPVASGTSGHLIGAALATALLGPWLGLASVATVLAVQALVFADGGLAALGTNVVLMGVVGVGVAAGVRRLAATWTTTNTRRALVAGAGALASVPVAAGAFALLYAIGGTASVPIGTLLGSMVGVHALIGIGEGLFTALVVAAVLALAPGAVPGATPATTHGGDRVRTPVLVAGLGAVAGVLAVAVARFASPHPDGLEFVASRLGFDVNAGAHALGGSLLADYGAVGGVDVGVAGLLGAGLVALAMWGLVRGVGRRSAV